jgi:hypothetical protein
MAGSVSIACVSSESPHSECLHRPDEKLRQNDTFSESDFFVDEANSGMTLRSPCGINARTSLDKRQQGVRGLNLIHAPPVAGRRRQSSAPVPFLKSHATVEY